MNFKIGDKVRFKQCTHVSLCDACPGGRCFGGTKSSDGFYYGTLVDIESHNATVQTNNKCMIGIGTAYLHSCFGLDRIERMAST